MDDVIPRQPESEAGTITVKRVGVFLGAEVTGVDLTQPLDEATVAAIAAAHVEHGVLAFPDQKISSADLMRFGRYFGELSVHPFSTGAGENPELIVYDNKEGNPPAPTDIWHTDETFRECPPMGTVLCSKVVPERGGDTNFCSMTAVFDGLSDRMQQFLTGLEAVHDFIPFKTLFDDTPEARKKMHEYEEIYRPVTHPVVSLHPVSGKKVLNVNPQFVVGIKGMEKEESDAILDLLYRKILRHEYQYRHHWRPDMVVFWDNRQVLHAALHDYYPQRRLMERVTIAGTRPKNAGTAPDPSTLRRYLMPPIMSFKNRQKRRHEL